MTSSPETTFRDSPVAPPVIAIARPRSVTLARVAFAPVKFLIGMLLTQSIAGALIILGWTHRLTRRSVLKQWWRKAPDSVRGENFIEWLRRDEATADQAHWPNWVIADQPKNRWVNAAQAGWWQRVCLVVRLALSSLLINVRLGLRAITCTWALTMPGCALMLFSWYAGWQNSFNKGYELYAVGPATGISGLLLFVAAMHYVPLAQARHAATGEWKSFFEFRVVWRIIRERWLGALLLAAAYLAAALPLMVIKTAVYFLPNNFPQMESWTDEQALNFLNTYFFWAAALFLPLFVSLRLLAGRLYAGGLLSALGRGTIEPAALAPAELEALERLQLREGRRRASGGRFVRVLAWFASRTGRVISGIILFFAWFLFAGKTVYLAEFLNFHPVIGWLNQPLVQLPFFRYVPGRLENFWNAQLAPLLLLAIGWLLFGAVRATIRSFRATVRRP